MAERSTRAGAHEQRAQAGDDPIRGTQVGCTLAPAIEDQQLMPDQHGFGDNATEATRPRQSGQSADQMNEYESEVAHPGNGINTSKTTALRSNLAISHRQAAQTGPEVLERENAEKIHTQVRGTLRPTTHKPESCAGF